MNLRNHKPRDWFRIIRDLMKAGVSMGKIARICGKSCAGVVQHWTEGGEPKDRDARVVLELYRRHCPDEYEKHMMEFDPEMLDWQNRVMVNADKGIRGKPKPAKVAVYRTPPGLQKDFFEEVTTC